MDDIMHPVKRVAIARLFSISVPRVVALAAMILVFTGGCHGNDAGDQDMARAFRARGSSLLQMNDTTGAGRYLSKAEDLYPDSADTQILIGEVLRREGNLDLAEVRYKKALALEPGSAEAQLNLGVLYGMRGRMNEALREFQAAAENEQFSHRDLAYDNIGQIYLDRHNLEMAEEAFRSAVRLNDRWAGSQVNLGRVLYKKGEIFDAANYFVRAVDLDPNSTEARYRLALAYIRLGQKADAIAELRNVIRMAPKGAHANDAREQLALLE